MKEKKVELKEDYGDMPKGSVFYVDKETKTLYKGIWPSMMGSYNVTVPKKLCKNYRKPKDIVIDKNTPEYKKFIKLMKKNNG